MRTLEINKRTVHYARRVGEDIVGDFDEVEPTYEPPQRMRGYVEYVRSSSVLAAWGRVPSCDLRLITSEPCVMTGEVRFWIDVPLDKAPDYRLARPPRKSINGTVYELASLEVSDA